MQTDNVLNMQLFNVVKVVCVKWWSVYKEFQYNVVVNKYPMQTLHYSRGTTKPLSRFSPYLFFNHVTSLSIIHHRSFVCGMKMILNLKVFEVCINWTEVSSFIVFSQQYNPLHPNFEKLALQGVNPRQNSLLLAETRS